jgi:23S rRNA (adenine1618-N6)-methyltransferase
MNDTAPKNGLHGRNPHRYRYDFTQLIRGCSALAPYVSVNQYGNESIDFSDPAAVRMLNKALLALFYGISSWDIPPGYLCPPIPGRADYIHHLADLLASVNNGVPPEGKSVSVLDIGTGANCIYPIIGSRAYGWRFTGTDIDPGAVASAQSIIGANPSLSEQVEIRLQEKKDCIFRGVIAPGESFALSMCNPPFHASLEEASRGTLRKLNNLKAAGTAAKKNIARDDLNFGGQHNELWCAGGESAFIHKMIAESALFPQTCLWFTTLVARKEHLDGVYRALKKAGVAEVRTIDMAQGQKISRIVAWSFFPRGGETLSL